MRRVVLSVVVLAIGAWPGLLATAQTRPPVAPNPVMVFDTLKGTIEIELFQADAPKSVAHILELMKRSFYRGQRFHRVEASLVQVGDPQSRDMSKEAYWGTGNSGRIIGVFELSKKHLHVRGAVGLGHSGNPVGADSQIYVMKAASPSLDGKYAVIGRVIAGMPVVDKIAVTDMIKDARMK